MTIKRAWIIILAIVWWIILLGASRYNEVQYLSWEVTLDNGIVFASAVVDEDTTTMLNRISPTLLTWLTHSGGTIMLITHTQVVGDDNILWYSFINTYNLFQTLLVRVESKTARTRSMEYNPYCEWRCTYNIFNNLVIYEIPQKIRDIVLSESWSITILQWTGWDRIEKTMSWP